MHEGVDKKRTPRILWPVKFTYRHDEESETMLSQMLLSFAARHGTDIV